MYKVIQTIKHNDRLFNPGEIIEDMSEDQASEMMKIGALQSVAETPTKPARPAKTDSQKVASTPSKSDKGEGQQTPPSTDKGGEETPKMTWSRQRLAEYADAHGITYKEEANRNEIFAAIKEAQPDPSADKGSEGSEEGSEGSDEGSDEGSEEGSEQNATGGADAGSQE